MEEEISTNLHASEIEAYLESLKIFSLHHIGSSRWFQQRERIYKLSLQAAFEVKSGREEVVKELTVTLKKIPILIHDLITTEIWRLQIFPRLMEKRSDMKSTVPIYMVLYHEVTLVSFLEAILFYEDSMETAFDVLVDLIDYCHRKILTLSSFNKDFWKEAKKNEDLFDQKKDLDFECGMKCISLLSYMAQHIKTLPLSALHRILVNCEVPLLFTTLIIDPPWERELKGEREKFYDGKWIKTNDRASLKLNKTEGQVWIALIQLFLNPDCQKKYEITSYKKGHIMKLRSKLNDVIIDQIPILIELLRFLEQLSIFDAPVPQPNVVIEQIPEIWEGLRWKHQGEWKQIAKKQIKYFLLSDYELQNFCKRVTDSFDFEKIEAVLPDNPICAGCGNKGIKRCSRCCNEWYCGRDCQVSHWSKHKIACDLMNERK